MPERRGHLSRSGVPVPSRPRRDSSTSDPSVVRLLETSQKLLLPSGPQTDTQAPVSLPLSHRYSSTTARARSAFFRRRDIVQKTATHLGRAASDSADGRKQGPERVGVECGQRALRYRVQHHPAASRITTTSLVTANAHDVSHFLRSLLPSSRADYTTHFGAHHGVRLPIGIFCGGQSCPLQLAAFVSQEGHDFAPDYIVDEPRRQRCKWRWAPGRLESRESWRDRRSGQGQGKGHLGRL